MSDLISREEAAKRLEALAEQRKGSFSGEAFAFAAKIVRGVPSAVRWIPVTERFPNLELVEVSAEDMDLFPCLVSKNTQKLRKGKLVTKAWYDGIGFLDSDCIDITKEVTHWMPLPEPPKGE